MANNNQRVRGRDNEAELEIPQTHGASSVIEPVLKTRGDILQISVNITAALLKSKVLRSNGDISHDSAFLLQKCSSTSHSQLGLLSIIFGQTSFLAALTKKI